MVVQYICPSNYCPKLATVYMCVYIYIYKDIEYIYIYICIYTERKKLIADIEKPSSMGSKSQIYARRETTDVTVEGRKRKMQALHD